MECQHHFDRAYLYTHHVHCHVLGVWVDRQLPAGLITTAVNFYGGCSMVKYEHLIQKITFEIVSYKTLPSV